MMRRSDWAHVFAFSMLAKQPRQVRRGLDVVGSSHLFFSMTLGFTFSIEAWCSECVWCQY